jgi:hypothetical protein
MCFILLSFEVVSAACWISATTVLVVIARGCKCQAFSIGGQGRVDRGCISQVGMRHNQMTFDLIALQIWKWMVQAKSKLRELTARNQNQDKGLARVYGWRNIATQLKFDPAWYFGYQRPTGLRLHCPKSFWTFKWKVKSPVFTIEPGTPESLEVLRTLPDLPGFNSSPPFRLNWWRTN